MSEAEAHPQRSKQWKLLERSLFLSNEDRRIWDLSGAFKILTARLFARAILIRPSLPIHGHPIKELKSTVASMEAALTPGCSRPLKHIGGYKHTYSYRPMCTKKKAYRLGATCWTCKQLLLQSDFSVWCRGQIFAAGT